MPYAQSNEGTKIPKAFKVKKSAKSRGIASGMRLYKAEMAQQARKAKKKG